MNYSVSGNEGGHHWAKKKKRPIREANETRSVQIKKIGKCLKKNCAGELSNIGGLEWMVGDFFLFL